MAFASTPTLLSLDRFAKILGINPVHFSGASGSEVWPVKAYCGAIWPQYTWQVSDNIVSREEVAESIRDAEADIKRVLGYSPALTWEGPEVINLRAFWNDRAPFHTWQWTHEQTPRLHKLLWGKVRAGGQPTPITSYGALRTLTYLDVDGDTYKEVARIANPVAPALPNLSEWRFFMPDVDANGVEIGDPVELTGARIRTLAGVHYIEFDAWTLLRKQLLTMTPVLNGFQPVAIEPSGNYVSGVYAVRETSNALPAARVRWAQMGTCHTGTCPACASQTQDGCLSIADSHLGMVWPQLGTCVNNVWVPDMGHACTNPVDMTVWYRAGATSKEYEAGRTTDPLDDYWAQTIAYLAAARLDKPVCGCTNVQSIVAELQRDLTRSDANNRTTTVDFNVLSNPFGTRMGEVKAWRRTMHFANQQIMDAGAF